MGQPRLHREPCQKGEGVGQPGLHREPCLTGRICVILVYIGSSITKEMVWVSLDYIGSPVRKDRVWASPVRNGKKEQTQKSVMKALGNLNDIEDRQEVGSLWNMSSQAILFSYALKPEPLRNCPRLILQRPGFRAPGLHGWCHMNNLTSSHTEKAQSP